MFIKKKKKQLKRLSCDSVAAVMLECTSVVYV